MDDPFLIDKMRNEKEGILLWALEGLHRLIQNNYQFTISERTAANLKEAMEQGNNILGFLKSEGYFEIRKGAKCKSTDFYKVYERWCLDNLEKPLAASTFIHHLKDNQKSLGIVYDDKCIGTNRGFHNVAIDQIVAQQAVGIRRLNSSKASMNFSRYHWENSMYGDMTLTVKPELW